jgi:hypothetical protein
MNYNSLVMIIMMVFYLVNSLIWYYAKMMPILVSLRHDMILMAVLFSFAMICTRVVQKVIYD